MKIHIIKPWNGSRRQWNRPLIYFTLAAALFSSSASAEMRVWEDTSGLPVKAEFVREIFGAAELRRPDGSLYSIPMENLSALDTTYVRTRITPEIALSVRKQKRNKVRNDNFVRSGDYISVVTAEIQIQKKSRAPYSGILRAEVYLIGQEVATDDYHLTGRGTSRVQFTEENKGVYTFQTSADFRTYEEYNNKTRGEEYAGYLVVIMDTRGNRVAVHTDISWLKDEKIDALRKFYIGSFFDENCRKRSVPRPLYYDARSDF